MEPELDAALVKEMKRTRDTKFAFKTYSETTKEENERRSKRDWFHALWFNYSACDMDSDLLSLLNLVYNTYAPIMDAKLNSNTLAGQRSVKQRQRMVGGNDNLYIERSKAPFVHETFQLVLEGNNEVAKKFLMLAVIAKETAAQKAIVPLCPAEKWPSFLPKLCNYTEQITHTPFNRHNVQNIINTHFIKLIMCYLMNVVNDESE